MFSQTVVTSGTLKLPYQASQDFPVQAWTSWGAWTPEVVTFRKFCKTKEFGPLRGGGMRCARPLRSANAGNDVMVVVSFNVYFFLKILKMFSYQLIAAVTFSCHLLSFMIWKLPDQANIFCSGNVRKSCCADIFPQNTWVTCWFLYAKPYPEIHQSYLSRYLKFSHLFTL